MKCSATALYYSRMLNIRYSTRSPRSRGMRWLSLITIAAVLFISFSLTATTQAAPNLVALATWNNPVGWNIARFRNPVSNRAGQVAFSAFLNLSTSTGYSGFFAGTPGSLQAFALQGAAAPAGGNYANVGVLELNGAGQVAFSASLTGGSSTHGIFAGSPGSPGSLQAVALQGAAAPVGGYYDDFSRPALNDAGQMAFRATLTGGTSAGGIFAGPPNALQAVALQGTAASGGGIYDSIGDPKLNGAGQVAFGASLTGSASPYGIFAGAPGSIQAVALSGAAAPTGGNYNTFTTPTLNTAGQVAFHATLTGSASTQGIFSGTPSSLQAVALRGAAAPAGGNYDLLYDLLLNGAGQVAFRATLTSGTSTLGIFAGAPGSIQAVALRGGATPAGGVYDNFWTTAFNEAGQIAFTARLAGPGINSNNETVLFAGLPGRLEQVVRDGDLIDVDPGPGIDFRTVAHQGIGAPSFSGSLLVYRLSFTDFSSGIFMSQIAAVPEPSSLALAALASAILWRRRRALRYRGRAQFLRPQLPGWRKPQEDWLQLDNRC